MNSVNLQRNPFVKSETDFGSTHTHTRLTRVSRYQKGKTNLDFTESRVL